MLNFCLRLKTSFENLDKNSLATFQKRKRSVLLGSGDNLHDWEGCTTEQPHHTREMLTIFLDAVGELRGN